MAGSLKNDIDLLWSSLWKEDEYFYDPGPCTKVSHDTISKAKKHIKRLNRGRKPIEQQGSYHVYWCQDCQAYHVGHKDVREKRLK